MSTICRQLGDEAARVFGEKVLASELVAEGEFERLVREFCRANPDQSLRSVLSLAQFLVSHGALTRWQAGNLLTGRYKGYFLGDFKLVDRVKVHERHVTFAAVQLSTGRRVFLAVRRAIDEPGTPFYYRVVDDESPDSPGGEEVRL